jgi:hypothetical protein
MRLYTTILLKHPLYMCISRADGLFFLPTRPTTTGAQHLRILAAYHLMYLCLLNPTITPSRLFVRIIVPLTTPHLQNMLDTQHDSIKPPTA